MPQISFVMPTKNRDHLIGDCINSIVGQTCADWELIIIDDHSGDDDKTRAVVDSFGDKRIRYYTMSSEQPSGIASARNYGNQMATAPIIAVVDSDDHCYPQRVARTLEAFEETGCDIFYSKYEIYFKDTGECCERATPIVSFSLEALKHNNIIPNGTTAYKREIAYQFPYNSFFRIGEDYDFFTRVAAAGKKFHFCDEILYRLMVHDSNTTHGNRFQSIEELIKMNRGWIKESESRLKVVGEMFG